MNKNQLFSTLLLIFLSFQVNAQLKVYSNGVEVKAGAQLKLQEIKTLTVKFDNAKKIAANTIGKAVVYAKVNQDEDFFIHVVEGYSAVEDFLYKTKKEQILINEDPSRKDKLTCRNCDNNHEDCHLKAFLQNRSTNPEFKTVEIELGLYFKEKLSYEKFGDAIPLLTPIKFKISVWEGELAIPNTDLAFIPEKCKNFNEFRVDSQNATKSMFIFGVGSNSTFLKYTTINLDTESANDTLEKLKASFENYLGFYANQYNGKKITKLFQDPSMSFWKQQASGYNKQGIHSFNAEIIYENLDQSKNPNFASEVVWEKFTLGKISGYKFNGLGKKTFKGNTNPTLKAEKASSIYLFVNPKNAKQLIIFYCDYYRDFTEEALNQNQLVFDSFISTISFK